MNINANGFRSYSYDNLDEGRKLKIEHTVYNDDNIDLSEFISKTVGEISAMREKSVKNEHGIYDKLQAVVKEWEQAAAVTQLLDRAMEYLRVPKVQHTSNEWVKEQYDYNTISNMVYKMSYKIQEGYSWRNKPARWDVKWYIYTNRPQNQYPVKVAGQEKSYATKEEAEKYIKGRIKAYANLFTEISPPIPDNLVKSFQVNGHLLPGYTTEAMQKQFAEKPSIKGQLSELKSQSSDKSKPEPTKKRPAPELG